MACIFRRIAIVNRGEAAMRLVHAVQELTRESEDSVEAVALYTEPDRTSMFVRLADDAVCLGPATFVDERDGEVKSSYLDYERLERALVESRADAAWVGWGFVAEQAEFAELCERLGITFVGPSAAAMRRVGDKISSKLLAEQAEVPVAPWSGGPVRSVDEAEAAAERIGYPLMVKATAGGGGRGIRRVLDPAELATAFKSAHSEALKSFGNGDLFLERLLPASRHIEVQVIADEHGTVWPVGVRDCSIQRRNQKVVEESGSPALSVEQEEEFLQAAARLCRIAGYTNAGTVEFLYDTATGRMSFMEVNARLQVEHPVTEETTGLDLVKLQLHVAGGGRLEGDIPSRVGNAIEVRLNAEDPENGFAPAPGTIELLRFPTGPGVRIDTGVSEGDSISAAFDSMIAKVIAWGRTRTEALARLSRALDQTEVVVRGGTTNRSFLLDLLQRPEVVSGEVEVGWLDRLAASGDHIPTRDLDVALLQAAVESYDEERAAEQVRFYAMAARGRPVVSSSVSHRVRLQARGNDYELSVGRSGPGRYRVEGHRARVELTVERRGRFERRLTCLDRSFTILSVRDGHSHLVEVDGVAHRIGLDAGGPVRASAPAVVVDVLVAEGDEVVAGQRLVVLEAMKMEMAVVAPVAGRVNAVMVAPHVQVEAAAPLVHLQPLGEQGSAGGSTARVDLSSLAGKGADVRPGERCAAIVDAMRLAVLGFDIDPAEIRRLVAEYGVLAATLGPDHLALIDGEDDVLIVFADACSLARTRPDPDVLAGEGATSSFEELLAYLRSIDSEGAGLSNWFLADLRRTLAHHGVPDLAPTIELREALFWVMKGQQRLVSLLPAVRSILDRRLEQLDAEIPVVGEQFRAVLDRVVTAAQRRYPDLTRQAREVRYQYFERPRFEEAAERAYAEIDLHLDALEAGVDDADRERRMQALVASPYPLKNFATGRQVSANPARRCLLLEALTRRYYRLRPLESFRVHDVEGFQMALSEYDLSGRRMLLITTFTSYAGLADAAAAVASCLDDRVSGTDVLVDFYVWRPGPTPDADVVVREVGEILAGAVWPRRPRRIVVAVSGPGRGLGMAGTQHLTFRATADGYREDEVLRGIHPMMGKRLRLDSLAAFRLRRLPSVEDVYLFHGVAAENPRDERLFGLAEVRDVSPVLDDTGRTAQLPQLERKLSEVLAAIREEQAARPAERRMDMNRVVLYVWPDLAISTAELRTIVYRMAAATEGLGIDEVAVQMRLVDPATGTMREELLRASNPTGAGVVIEHLNLSDQPLGPLTEYQQQVLKLRRRGLVYPYELIRMLTPSVDGLREELPAGDFVEYDLDERTGQLVPVDRDPGSNSASIVVGILRNVVPTYPEGMARVALFGDPSKGLGSLAEPECRRIIAAVDLAQERALPVEWFAVSAGAKIAMDSGTENMDWIARVLRRIIEFTQDGGEINVVVAGINVGAQPYWNAEATMLMHTRGILVMTPESAMVLTGKQALDYSGGVSAEDNQGIGGYERIMGPNGQAQFWAPDVIGACRILLRHYEHTYSAPGERYPRRAATTDPIQRDIRTYPHDQSGGPGFATVGEVFSETANSGRKKPFDIRSVMRAVTDQDHAPLERWAGFRHAEGAVVWDAHLGGWPVCLIGLESKPLPRRGFVPADGPDHWTSGTLFPMSSKKVARSITTASGNRPVVVLANLSGFDGSPESMSNLQLEYGAEIGRAVVNFRGPMVFCVVSRYHGGAFVVFSAALNESLEVAALQGSYASVIGGAPAAAVVFAREVDARTSADPRIVALRERLAASSGSESSQLRLDEAELYEAVRSERLGEVADEFDRVHSVERALAVGSVHRILPPAELRPYLVSALDRKIEADLAPVR